MTDTGMRSFVRATLARWDAWCYLRCRVCGTRKDHLPGIGVCRRDVIAPARTPSPEETP